MAPLARYFPLFLYAGLWISAPVSAQTVDRPPDDGILRVPDVTIDVPRIDGPTSTGPSPSAPTAQGPVELDDKDLKANPALASFILGKSVQARDWNTVRRVLAYYADISGHDPLLTLYARGALDRQDGQHGQAIAAYREMLTTDAGLTYIRLDLAAMLFEDKQFHEARQRFTLLQRDPDLVPTAQQAIAQYLAAIRSQNKWNGTVRVGYKYNDNVNNASAERYIDIYGLRFEKDPESLPRSASAVAYHANLNRDFNLGGNHFLSVDGTVEGDHYWNDRDWSETTATLRAGYRYRNVNSWLSILPSLSEAWLGGDPYRRTVGASLEYGRWLSPKWQIMGNYSWFNKKYKPSNFSVYNGNLHALTATAVHFNSANTIFYGGLTVQRDLLQAKYESSARDGASLGFIKLWTNGLDIRVNARYSTRKFRGYSLWDMTRLRRDHEYQLDVSVAHNKLKFAGISPRLSYQFLKVDSSIASLYSRTGNQLVLALEKNF